MWTLIDEFSESTRSFGDVDSAQNAEDSMDFEDDKHGGL